MHTTDRLIYSLFDMQIMDVVQTLIEISENNYIFDQISIDDLRALEADVNPDRPSDLIYYHVLDVLNKTQLY